MKKLLMILLMLFILGDLTAQMIYTLDNTSSDMMIMGTSTLHDWESDVEEISGNAELIVDGQVLKQLDQLNLTIRVKSIKSGKSGMDKNTYNALNAADFPNITYKLNSTDKINHKDLRALGTLTISGASVTKEMITQYVVDGQSISFNGTITFNMTEFNIDPPTALMGTIKTGDEVIIDYDVIFNKN